MILKNKLTKTIIEKLIDDLKKVKNINEYLINLENKIEENEVSKNESYKNNILALSSAELSNKILKNLILEIRYENKCNKKIKFIGLFNYKLNLLNEVYNLNNKNENNLIFKLLIDPINYLEEDEYDDLSDENNENEEKDELDKEFEKFLSNGVSTSKNDFKYFKNLDIKKKRNI